MKLNNASLRLFTSCIMVIVVFVVWILFPVKGVFLLVSIVTASLIWEYYKLLLHKLSSVYLLVFFLVLGLISYFCFLFLDQWLIKTFVSVVVAFFILCFWAIHRLPKENIILILSGSLWSLFYICLPSALFLRTFLYQEEGPTILLLFLGIICSGDIFAYIGGSLIGGKKWVPHLSPNKTWAGLFCGTLISAMVSSLGFYFIFQENLIYYFIFGAISFGIAQTGDLFISLLKRLAGVKNTGNYLLGHGGLLDRLDGFLLALPFMYLFVFEGVYFF